MVTKVLYRANHPRSWRTRLFAVLVVVSGSLALAGCSGLVGANSSTNGGGTPTPLTISGPAASSQTVTGGVINWQTNSPATSQVEFGNSTAYGSATPLDGTMVTNHQQALSSLKPGTLYHFRVHSTDANKNAAVSTDVTFSTLADTAPPTVSILSPAAGATLSGAVTLTVSASDNVGVASVQYKVDNANSGTPTMTAPFSFNLNTTTLSTGNHVLSAVAADTSGNTATSATVSVKVDNTVPDTTAPTVSISAPASGATVSGSVTASANASDNIGVASVQFQLDGANVGTLDTFAPYNFAWDTTASTNGAHTLRAIAKDAAGNSTTSAAVSVTVNNTTPDTTPPTVSISSPANGVTVSGTITVSANASDNIGVASVQFQLDGANVGTLDTVAPYNFAWNTATATNASHTLRAIAKDAANNSTTSASVTVTVNNTAPAPDTTPPSVPSGLTATAASSSQINLGWTASTDNVGVTGYKVFRGGTQIGTSTTTSFSDTGLPASTSFSYTVAAFDAAGNTSAQSASATATTLAAGGGGIPNTLGWFQIPNTQLAPNCPSDPAIQGNDGCWAVIGAWNSGIADTKRNRLVFTGGGHMDYAGNEVYALDLNSLTMMRLNNSSAPNGNCGETYADGTPTSRHTYGGLAYIPSVDKMYMHGGAYWPCGQGSVATWLFDLSTLKWQQQDPVNGTAVTKDCCNYQSFSAYDPNNNAVYYVDDGTFWKYVAGTNTQTGLSNPSGIGSHITAVVDSIHKLFLVFGEGQTWQADLSSGTPSLINITSQTTGCSGLAGVDYPGLAYDPVQNLVVGWTGGGGVFLYNAATKSCTTKSFSGGPGAAQLNGTFGRFQYFPALGVFALVNDWQQNAFTLRLTAVSGGTGSGPVISGVGASAITTSGATVSWTTDVTSTSQVEYGTTTAYGSLTTLNSILATSHSVSLTGLATNTLYHYRVRSKNSGGIESIGTDFAFQTNNTTDTIPPTAGISSPASGATVSGTVTVSASASDNVGVASVQFQLDGVNVGSPVTSAPYTLTWNTTASSNGAHSLSAQARDAAGNVGTSVAVGVTVSNTTSTALQDFQTRCAQAGVLICQGFDDPTVFAPAVWPGSGLYPSDDGVTIRGTLDPTVTASGAGSLMFTIPSLAGSNSSGYWRQLIGKSFGARSTFYVQFRQRFSPEFLTNKWTQVGGGTTWWKQEIFSNNKGTCADVELTTINQYSNGWPTMYSQCGADNLYQDLGNGDLLLEQGDSSSTGYNCHYQSPTASTCFMYPANTWVTFYYKVSIGDWGQPNSTIQAWVALPGQPYKEWINIQNHALFNSAPGNDYDMVTLLPYMTNRDASVSAGPVSFTWYDELIVATQPIAAPK
jgi:hypothetical protein